MPELARDPVEQCCYFDENKVRCLNYGTVADDSPSGVPPLRDCGGPHRFTVDESVRREQAMQAVLSAIRGWYAAHPDDHRTPTEIAQGVTDKNPTRMHTIKPDGSVPTLGLPAKTAPNHWGESHKDPKVGAYNQLAEGVCNLLYEELGVRDVNLYSTKEPMDRCEFVNKLVLLMMENGWVHIERSSGKVTEAEKVTDHLMKLNGERFRELEAIRRLVGGDHLEYVAGGASALSLVTELVEGNKNALAVIKDLKQFLADAEGRK